MSCDDKLGIVLDQVMNAPQHRKLPLRREGSLRFIKEIKTVPMKTVQEQRQKRFPVRLLVQRPPSICRTEFQFLKRPYCGQRKGITIEGRHRIALQVK